VAPRGRGGWTAQLLRYLKLSGKAAGLLLNCDEPVLRKGLKRTVNHYAGPEGRRAPPLPLRPNLMKLGASASRR
jgi:hypothetical protein